MFVCIAHKENVAVILGNFSTPKEAVNTYLDYVEKLWEAGYTWPIGYQMMFKGTYGELQEVYENMEDE